MAVANYDTSIQTGKLGFNVVEKCYLKKLSFTVTGDEYRLLYDGMKHQMLECNPEECKFCNGDESVE
jgi:hypothetical protein